MRYYKQTADGYILSAGTGAGNTEITESEYGEIMTAIRSRPDSEDRGYRLKTDLTWEEYDPPAEAGDEEELSDEEALQILLGGAT